MLGGVDAVVRAVPVEEGDAGEGAAGSEVASVAGEAVSAGRGEGPAAIPRRCNGAEMLCATCWKRRSG